LWSSSASTGVVIPYTAITVHAQVGSAVLLELNLSDSNITPDEDIEHLQLRITPTSIAHNASTKSTGSVNGSGENPSTALYKAIGDCQELNPDPMDRDSDEDSAFDETAPGATGWITSENVADFEDENGNFQMPEGVTVIGDEDEEPLGQGAGRVRTAQEVDGDDDEGGKWQRTD
jgi:nucleotide-sensitive chloride channel 1A